MHSFKLVQAASLALLALVSSQAIDPSTVSLQIRKTWCTNQKAACPLLCTQISDGSGTAANLCDATTLSYSCVCENGQVPNATEFSQTIPFYQCQESNNQCANNCDSGNNACVTSCRTANPCGAKDPTRHNVTSTDSSATATGTRAATASGSGTASATGSGTEETEAAASTGFFGAPSATSSSAASSNMMASKLTFQWAEACGLSVILASFFAGFAIIL